MASRVSCRDPPRPTTLHLISIQRSWLSQASHPPLLCPFMTTSKSRFHPDFRIIQQMSLIELPPVKGGCVAAMSQSAPFPPFHGPHQSCYSGRYLSFTSNFLGQEKRVRSMQIKTLSDASMGIDVSSCATLSAFVPDVNDPGTYRALQCDEGHTYSRISQRVNKLTSQGSKYCTCLWLCCFLSPHPCMSWQPVRTSRRFDLDVILIPISLLPHIVYLRRGYDFVRPAYLHLRSP